MGAAVDFETGVNGNALSTADAGSITPFNAIIVGGSTIKYDNTHVAAGALAAKVDVVSGSFAFARIDTIGSPTDHFGRAYLYFPANPGDDRGFIQITDASDNQLVRLTVSSIGKIGYQDSTFAGSATAASLATAQLIRVEWHIIHSATVGQVEIKLFNLASSTIPTETKTSSANLNTGVAAARLRIGHAFTSSGTDAYWVDDVVAAADAYPGPKWPFMSVKVTI